MKQLDFTLSLIDKLSRPLKQAQSSLVGFAEKSKAASMQIGGGVLALAAAGMAIKGALSPAIAMFDALNDAAAKGIDDSVLKTVQRDALRFSTTYGVSAVDFVKSTEDINTAIAGLSNAELPKITQVANTLAFSLKSTAAETAEFMGQMYGNFAAEAQRLGKVPFAEQLAGKMVTMRKVFGTEMATVKDLMEGARGVGTNYGVGMDEQLAVLGQLRRTLGTEASSAYEGFMTSAIAGAKKLGLSFTDVNGKMLSMPDMLIKLQNKYGQSLEGNLRAQAELDAAFGDSAAVVKHLYGNVALLQRNITALGGADGLKRTQEMAADMVKPWDRFVEILKAIQTVIGLTLIPVLYPVLNRLADMGQTFARWMQLFPNIARVIGYATLGLLSFAAAGAAANIVMGLGKMVGHGWAGMWKMLVWLLKLDTAWTWINTKAKLAWAAVLRGLRGVLLALRMQALLTGAAINFMSWPILLIIGAIALLAAGCYLLVKHWDTVKAAVMNTAAFTAAAGVVEWLAGVFTAAWQWIAEGWNRFIALLTGFSPSQALSGMASGIVSMFDNVWQTIKGGFLTSWRWIVEKLNKIPGVNISLDKESAPALTTNTLSTGAKLQNAERGGISKSMSSHRQSVTDNSRKIGTVNIYPKETLAPGQLMEWQELGV